MKKRNLRPYKISHSSGKEHYLYVVDEGGTIWEQYSGTKDEVLLVREISNDAYESGFKAGLRAGRKKK